MPDTPVADRDGGPYDPSLERRVLRLEEDGRDVKAAIARLEDSNARLEMRVDRLDAKFERLEAKFDRIETAFQRLELGFVRLEAMLTATLPYLATKVELAATRAEVQANGSSIIALRSELKSDITAGLVEKPSKTYMWGILAVLPAAYACGLAALAALK
jgi:chromosome segregation ATPase